MGHTVILNIINSICLLSEIDQRNDVQLIVLE